MTPMACGLSAASRSRWQHRNNGPRSCYVQDPGYLCPNNALMPSSKDMWSRSVIYELNSLSAADPQLSGSRRDDPRRLRSFTSRSASRR